ncbi:MAG: phosphoglycerate kinase [Caldiserica bacterium]|nr:MAG: phosphoglycerate kinase [Caldisericota bacterium]
MRSIKDADVKGKRIFVRGDLNVPLKEGEVRDNTRIVALLPTIKYLVENGSKVILASHLGRPKGKVVPELSLKPVYEELKKLLPSTNIYFVNDCVGEEVKNKVNELKEGEILLLENLRFHPEEEKNDENFAKELASLADIFVQDAFGTVHRAHASTVGIAKFLPSYAGFLLEKEVKFLSKVTENPEKPFIAIIGGAKISTKIGVIENLLKKVDKLLIGGAMAYTFLKKKGKNIGKSLCEDEYLEVAGKVLDNAEDKLLLPLDHIVTDNIDEPKRIENTPDENIPDDMIGVDIGTKTISEYAETIKEAKTVFWNGPLGVFEKDEFSKGTREIGKIVAELTEKGTVTVVGGGDSVAAVKKENLQDKISHISTGGGASLEFVEGKKLPGLEVLE